MSDYIKREDAIKAVKDNSYSLTDDEYIEINGYAAIEQIEGIPAADVKPAVSCKDCEYNRMCSQYIDIFDRHYHIGFCSIGERSGLKK